MHAITGARIDDSPIGARQYAVLALVLLALIVDGIDIQLLSLVAPRILAEWGVGRAAFGPAMSAALIGMTIGASLGGWLGDRFGRKTILVAATLFFGAMTVAAAVSDGLYMLAALRLLSGLGFGAVAPNGASLLTEWLPIRVRARVIGLLSVTIPLGGILGASAVLALLSLYGWRGCFIACGLATVLLAAACAAWLPESPSFLTRIGRRARAERLFQHIAGPGIAFAPAAADPAAGRGSIFTRANLRLNIGAWLTNFMLQFIAYAMIAWSPVFMTMAGWPLERALRATVAFNFSAIAAGILAGFLVSRIGFRTMLLGGCACTLASVLLLAAALEGPAMLHREWIVLAASGGIGVFSGVGIAAIYMLLAFVYPVACRASGIGMGLMMGRAGGIAITLTGGLLLSAAGTNLLPFFAALALAVLAALAGTLILGPHLGRVTE